MVGLCHDECIFNPTPYKRSSKFVMDQPMPYYPNTHVVTQEFTHNNHKTFNDSIHGHITFHPLIVKIIDTPQFQRLRNLKQLGGAYLIFSGASHNRFEHSLGVCHLAGKLIQEIRSKQPDLGITDSDVLCVQIAGLCHDLGHGPFSHMFDGKFIPRMFPQKNWKHEQCSCDMIDLLIAQNDLMREFHKAGLGDADVTFIKEMILKPESNQPWPYNGRGVDKSFLYEIVSNSINSIDVDKWDYFARDCHHLGIGNNFDHNRLLKCARVIEVDGKRQICYRDKEALNLYDMFYTRLSLHRRVYQHRVCKVIEIMITDAMVKADDYILIRGSNRAYKMSECINDMEAFTNLTDHIFYQILSTPDDRLKESQDILRRLLNRQLYTYIGSTPPQTNSELREDEVRLNVAAAAGLDVADIVVQLVKMDYGCGEANPIDSVYFYKKSNPNVAIRKSREDVSLLLPDKFSERKVLVFCRDEKNVEKARRGFERYYTAARL